MASKAKSRSSESTRLDASAWTQAAIEALGTRGIDGVRVELLAKQLAVTKGSFYWHFKDRDALHEAMLTHWRRRATLYLIERLDRVAGSPEDRFRQLLRVPMHGRRAASAAGIELAIRLWGQRDERAKAALEEVDALRLQYISGLLSQCGVAESEARPRSILAYSYMRVAATLVPHDAEALIVDCENLLLGRR